MSAPSDGGTGRRSTKRAGAFDIRIIIGALLGIYGIVVLVTGLVNGTGSGTPPKGDPEHLNLYVGGGLVVAACLFMLWTKWRPLRVPDEADAVEDDGEPPKPPASA
jgi:hypothetical protein